MNYEHINMIFNAIMAGDPRVITSDNIKFINDEALRIYAIPILVPQDIDELKKIIMICNVLYNRTDMNILPIEDGFYDLLLEKYKNYDPNFQVGSAVVQFANFKEDSIPEQAQVAQCPVVFTEKVERDELHQSIYNDIMRTGKPILNIYDFYQSPISFNTEKISKRSHNTEHNHPMLVGTLDKAKFVTNQDAIDAGAFNDSNVKILERDFFQNHINKGIISPNDIIGVVCELKYDGVSVEADCGFTLSSARTRGDTGIGEASDITPILKDYIFKQASCMIGEEDVGVKFEAIMTKSNLELFNRIRGKSYANCRTAIIGLFGASDAYMFRDLITLVPLALDRENFKYNISNRLEEIEFLNRVFVSNGEPLRYCYFEGPVQSVLYQIKAFWNEAKIARDYLNFLYDGIVISYLDEDIRAKLGRENYINKFSMAVKFDPWEKQTIFRGYTYEVGQHGNITPMIHYDPVEFMGTIHTKSTGSSLNRFNSLGLKYGDIINVTYVNDVMPYVSTIDCEHNRNNPNPKVEIIKNCPVCGTELITSDSGKSLICPNKECAGRSTQRMVNMFAKLNIKGFADATFNILSDFDHLYKLYDYEDGKIIIRKDFYVDNLGIADGEGFSNALLRLITDDWKDYIIMGSLGFTSMAYKKWQGILQFITLLDLERMYQMQPDAFMVNLINTIPGIGEVTAKTVAIEWSFFENDIKFILDNVHLINSFGNSDICKGEIRFTGFRNLQLAEQLNTAGYDAGDGSVTKKTDILLIPFEGFSSTKVNKAKSNPNTKIIPVQEFIENSEMYIGIDLR